MIKMMAPWMIPNQRNTGLVDDVDHMANRMTVSAAPTPYPAAVRPTARPRRPELISPRGRRRSHRPRRRRCRDHGGEIQHR